MIKYHLTANYANISEDNLFYHPMNSGSYDPDTEVTIEVQVGSKRYPMSSPSEAFYQVHKTLSMHNSAFHTLDIAATDYRGQRLIVAVEFEKVSDRNFTWGLHQGWNINDNQIAKHYCVLQSQAWCTAPFMHIT